MRQIDFSKLLLYGFHLIQRSVSLLQYLGIFLSIVLAVCIVSLILFASLAEDVIENEEIVVVDLELANALYEQATPATTDAFIIVSFLGSQVVSIIAVVVALYYAFRRQWLWLLAWVITLAGGELLNVVLKAVFSRPRPVFAEPLAVEIYYSFPSGHAMLSLIAYGMLAYLLALRTPSRIGRILLIFAAVLLVVLIGISRLYLGVHYLSDVVAGYLAGSAWLAACIAAMGVIRRRRNAALQEVTVPA